ncbi:hypothetical protein Tco_0851915 [Tanacetum coccineum]
MFKNHREQVPRFRQTRLMQLLPRDTKNQASSATSSKAPHLSKAVEAKLCTLLVVGAHSHQNCPSHSWQRYRDKHFLSINMAQAAAANYKPIWEKLSLPNLFQLFMTLELADRSISNQGKVAKDLSVKVLGGISLPADLWL